MAKWIESRTSMTAQMTCLSRACSSREANPCYRSDDFIAPVLLPGILRTLLGVPLARKLFTRIAAPRGIYEYVIARTKYIDAAYKKALLEQFDQILIFGAGFDSRAIRFREAALETRVFELDVPFTQNAKISQYRARGIALPPNLTFIAIDFDKEPLPEKFEAAGFRRGCRSLFILEGLLMYLQPKSVDATFHTIRDYAGTGSLAVFDYIHAAVLRNEGLFYGEEGTVSTVSSIGEGWQFGIEEDQIEAFLVGYSMRLIDHSNAGDLEKKYFHDSDGNLVGRMNETHCLVTAETI